MSIRAILGLACIAALVAAAPAAGANGKAATYCKKQRGTMQVRYPAYGTNTPATQIRLSGAVPFCKFRAQAGRGSTSISRPSTRSNPPWRPWRT